MFTRRGPKSRMGPICQLATIYLFRVRERNLNGDRRTVGLRQLSRIQPLTNLHLLFNNFDRFDDKLFYKSQPFNLSRLPKTYFKESILSLFGKTVIVSLHQEISLY